MTIPEKLIESLDGIPGFNRHTFIESHAHPAAITSIRINPLKITSPDMLAWPSSQVPWSSFGYYLNERPSFTTDPLFHAGCYYVQEASGMFLEQVLRQTNDLSQRLRVLDCCAAPGGKSTLLQSIISADSMLVSNEVIRSRVGILKENLDRWGAGNVIASNNDPADFSRLENFFDVIVADAPCSGSGLFRRDAGAANEWSEEAVHHCSLRQQRIIADVWPALKKGGVFIYSTCSYSKEENENVLDWIKDHFDAESLRITIDDSWGIIESESEKNHLFGYRFFPDRLKGEGFFIAAIRKRDGGIPAHLRTKKGLVEKLQNKETDQLNAWIDQANSVFFRLNDHVHVLLGNMVEELAVLQSALYLKKAGVVAGTLVSGTMIPDHELAMSQAVQLQIPRFELSLTDALRYLRKEEINIDTALKGWALVQYQAQNLGWIKLLPGRINNYYPKELRILKRD